MSMMNVANAVSKLANLATLFPFSSMDANLMGSSPEPWRKKSDICSAKDTLITDNDQAEIQKKVKGILRMYLIKPNRFTSSEH